MKFFVKLILIICILFGLSYYYKLFDFSYGFVKKEPDGSDFSKVVSALTIKEVYYTKITDEKYIFIFENEEERYITSGEKNDFDAIQLLDKIGIVETNNHSYIPLIIGAVAIIVVICVRTRKRR